MRVTVAGVRVECTMGSKLKKSTIKYNKKKGREKLKRKITGGGAAKKKPKSHHGHRTKKAEREEQREEEKGKKMGVDQFLDQDFGDGSDASPSASLDDQGDMSDDSLSPLGEENYTDSANSVEKEAKSHKDALMALKEKDPEFYKYLQESESNLLDFDSDDDEAGGESTSDEEDEGKDEDGEAPTAAGNKKVFIINEDSTNQWCQSALDKGSLGAVKNVLKAYRVGCHYGDDEDETSQISFRLSDSNVFNQLMLFVLKHMDGIFRRILESGGRTQGKPSDSPKWKKVEPLVKSYLGNTLHLVSNVTEAPLSAYICQRLRASVDLFHTLPVLSKKLLKFCLKSFGTELGNVKADRTLRIQSILVVRALAVHMGDDLAEDCYKGLYRTFRSCAKFTNAQNIQSVHFMQDCIVEVYGVHTNHLYKYVFNAIKEIALLVRTALVAKTKEASQRLLSWETVSCLDLLERLVSRYGAKEGQVLQPMVYPLVQLMMMTVTLVPSSKHLPLRFHLVKTMLRLSAKAGCFVPVSSMVLDALSFSELIKKPSGVGNYFSFVGVLKVPKPVLRTTSFQDQWVTQAVLLLLEHCDQWSHHIAFPEFFLPIAMRLKTFVKSDAFVKKFKHKLAQVLEAGQKTCSMILTRRQKADFSPKDGEQISLFMEKGKASGPSPVGKLYKALMLQAKKQDKINVGNDVVLEDPEAMAAMDLDAAQVKEYSKNIIKTKEDKSKTKSKSKKKEAAPRAEEEDKHKDEDRVEDFELSDSESES